jgi:hypothetical protein
MSPIIVPCLFELHKTWHSDQASMRRKKFQAPIKKFRSQLQKYLAPIVKYQNVPFWQDDKILHISSKLKSIQNFEFGPARNDVFGFNISYLILIYMYLFSFSAKTIAIVLKKKLTTSETAFEQVKIMNEFVWINGKNF